MWLQNKLLNLLIEQKNQLIKLLGEYERDAKASASRPKPEPEPVDPEEKYLALIKDPRLREDVRAGRAVTMNSLARKAEQQRPRPSNRPGSWYRFHHPRDPYG
jgi:hypothetical protein